MDDFSGLMAPVIRNRLHSACKKKYCNEKTTYGVFQSLWIRRMTIPRRRRWWILSRPIRVAGHLRVRCERRERFVVLPRLIVGAHYADACNIILGSKRKRGRKVD